MQAPSGSARPVGGPFLPTGAAIQSQFPVSFELVLTDELPNGPYGEMGITGVGKLFCKPDSTYNDVAVALKAAWIKARGSMMQMNTSAGPMAMGIGGQYSEDWWVVSIEYKGGIVAAEQQASAGTHTGNLGLVQTSKMTGGCCTIA